MRRKAISFGSCGHPSSAVFFVTHPPLPCVLSGEGLLLRSRACTGLLFACFYSLLYQVSSRSRPLPEKSSSDARRRSSPDPPPHTTHSERFCTIVCSRRFHRRARMRCAPIQLEHTMREREQSTVWSHSAEKPRHSVGLGGARTSDGRGPAQSRGTRICGALSRQFRSR